MIRRYKVEFEIETNEETPAKAKDMAKLIIESLGLSNYSLKSIFAQRTLSQNRSLHKFLDNWAKELRAHGYTMKDVLSKPIELPPTMILLKELVWKPTQEKLFGKKSTTELFKNQGEIDDIVDVITKAFGEKFQLYVPFPSVEEQFKKYESQN